MEELYVEWEGCMWSGGAVCGVGELYVECGGAACGVWGGLHVEWEGLHVEWEGQCIE